MYFFHENFDVTIMNRKFILNHYKLRIGATMIIINKSKSSFKKNNSLKNPIFLSKTSKQVGSI